MKLFWLAFASFIIPVFVCGITLLAYLIFPPSDTNILIVGMDGRGNEGLLARTDSIMILGIRPSQLRVSLLSIPRDLFIETPGYGSQRINTIQLLGEEAQAGSGIGLLSEVIEQTFGISIDRYIRLNFQDFVHLVDSVGGVDIDVERTIDDGAYPTDDGGTIQIRFDSGTQYMDGERALMYARTRHADDDYQRAARQQQVISALLSKLANPSRWSAALGVFVQAVDTDMTLWDMGLLAAPVILNRGRFERLVIDRDYILGTTEGHAIPNLDAILPWLKDRFSP
jgi:LCP family protein required for cell wall assembly